MPGLIRGVARTAAVAGTATAVSGRVARRQQGKWAEKDAKAQAQQQPQYAAQPAPQPQYVQQVPVQQVPVQQVPVQQAAVAAPSMDEKLAQLQQLGQLKDSGVLTAAEFEAQKAKILAG